MRVTLAFICVVAATTAWAADDRDLDQPTDWWLVAQQTADQLRAAVKAQDARVVDLQLDPLSPFPFTASLVANKGPYAKQWWWIDHADRAAVENLRASHNAHLTSLRAVDVGAPSGPDPYFTATMIADGNDPKDFAWYFDVKTKAEIDGDSFGANARLLTLRSYSYRNYTRYVITTTTNVGTRKKDWTYLLHASPDEIKSTVAQQKMRIIDLSHAGQGAFHAVMESCANGCAHWWWYVDKSFTEIVDAARQNHARIVTIDSYPGCGSRCYAATMVLGAQPTPHGTDPDRLYGAVDLHTHPLSTLGFGGALVYGGIDGNALLPIDPDGRVNIISGSMQQSLGHDGAMHGGPTQSGDFLRGQIISELQKANHANNPDGDAMGAPSFPDWPKWNDITHQRMWVDWIQRAWHLGGLRVLVALAVNNRTLGDAVHGPLGFPLADDARAVDIQIDQTKKFVSRHDFMEIAYSSADLKRIVHAGKLAVVLGVEVDDIGNLMLTKQNSEQAVRAAIDRLYQAGVRYAFPVHVIDNLFGGTAVYEPTFNLSNYRETNHFWNLACSKPADGINYRYSPAGFDVGLAAVEANRLGQDFLRQPPDPPNCACGTGHVNSQALTSLGEVALKEMMRLGMMIDIDHMSQATMNRALYIALTAAPGGYPVSSGHANIRSTDKSCSGGTTERNLSAGQYKAIGTLHGMAGIGSADTGAYRWAQIYVQTIEAMGGHGAAAFGTDTNGVAKGMPPLLPRALGRPATALPAGTNGQQHIYYRSADNQIIHIYRDSQTGVRGSEILAGDGSKLNVPAAAGDPAVMLPGGTNNQQHIFFRDQAGEIVHVFWDASSGLHWDKWAGMGGDRVPPPAAGDPATMTPGGTNNQQHIFYRDRSGSIQHVYWDPDSGPHWDTWAAGNGNDKQGPAAAGNPVTMLPGGTNNQQHIFYRDLNGNLQHVFWDRDSGMHPEVWAGPAKGQLPLVGEPAAMLPGDTNDQQHVFYRDSKNNLIHVYWDKQRGGPPKREVWGMGTGSKTFGAAAGGDPATVVTPGQQHVFYRDLNGLIRHVFWDQGKHVMTAQVWTSKDIPNASGALATMGTGTPEGHDLQQHVFYRDVLGNIAQVYWSAGKPGLGGQLILTGELWSGATSDEYLPPVRYDNRFGRSSLGLQQWDFNVDGVAHYGMLADFLRAVRSAPLGNEIIDDNLMLGAEAFFQMWRLVEAQRAQVH